MEVSESSIKQKGKTYRLIRAYCDKCLKFDFANADCKVFKECFVLWGQGPCPARVEDPRLYIQELRQLIEYAEKKLGVSGSSQVRARFTREIDRALRLVTSEIQQAFYEDVNRPLLKPPHEKKSDRTHKLFPAERMKDNRYKEPWQGF